MNRSLLSPDFFSRLKESVILGKNGFRYGYVGSVFREDIYDMLVAEFPDPSRFTLVDKQSGGGRKHFYIGPAYTCAKAWGSAAGLQSVPQIWKEAFDEVSNPDTLIRMQEAMHVPLNTVANFGFAYGKSGCMQEPHLDGAIRPGDKSLIHSTVACLIYINKDEGGSSGTAIYDTDRKTALFQVPTLRNSFFFFEQHPNAWHGFPALPPGEERQIISLAYSLEKKPIPIRKGVLFNALPTIARRILSRGRLSL